jgi:glucose-6-phosphate dehydrogenase assembly protein OpcA
LVRDIPTFILWIDTVCDKRDALYHAMEQAEKLLIDSEHSISLGDPEERLLSTLRDITVRESTPVADFTFKRVRPLQRLVAAAFDDPHRIPLLDEVAALHISGISHVAARLFSLWLADRLGWKPTGDGFHDRRGREISFNYEPNSTGCTSEIVIQAKGGERVEIRTQEAGCADVDFPEGGESHPVISSPEDGVLLLEEVDNIASDPLFRAALSIL